MLTFCICIGVALQLHWHQHKCKCRAAPLCICVSSDNDVGKGGSALHLYWRQRNCRAMPTQMQSGTDADAERRRLCRPLPSPHLSSSLSSTIATCSPQRRRRSPLLKR
ncbi:hypothetical protein GW17_00015225 [Ensete ventricosum]|nr:hypothetical protein GW17_00015225 [Ensete ventricosum]